MQDEHNDCPSIFFHPAVKKYGIYIQCGERLISVSTEVNTLLKLFEAVSPLQEYVVQYFSFLHAFCKLTHIAQPEATKMKEEFFRKSPLSLSFSLCVCLCACVRTYVCMYLDVCDCSHARRALVARYLPARFGCRFSGPVTYR